MGLFNRNKKEKELQKSKNDFLGDLGITSDLAIKKDNSKESTKTIVEANTMQNQIINRIKDVQRRMKDDNVIEQLDEVIDNIRSQTLKVYNKDSQNVDILISQTLDMLEKQNYDISSLRLDQYVTRLRNLSKQRSNPSALYKNRKYVVLDHKSYEMRLQIDEIKNEVSELEQRRQALRKEYDKYIAKGDKVRANQCVDLAKNYTKQIDAKKMPISYLEQMLEQLDDAIGVMATSAVRDVTAFMNGVFDGLMDEISEITNDTTNDLKNVDKLKGLISKFKGKISNPTGDVKEPEFSNIESTSQAELSEEDKDSIFG